MANYPLRYSDFTHAGRKDTIQQRRNADTSDHVGPTVSCACGQPARYAGRHARTFTSVLGPLKLERAHYCESCKTGFCPRDRALHLEGTSLSPAVTRMVGLVGSMVSFEDFWERRSTARVA
jgi:hypothetical protein